VRWAAILSRIWIDFLPARTSEYARERAVRTIGRLEGSAEATHASIDELVSEAVEEP
jgi:hypothetical protein